MKSPEEREADLEAQREAGRVLYGQRWVDRLPNAEGVVGDVLTREEAFARMSARHFKSKDKREKRAVQKREAA